MAKYFFNIRSDEGLTQDNEGSEHPDNDSALLEAEMSVRDLLADAIKARLTVDGRTMEIADESGAVVGRIVYRDILEETAST
jgi:hypothetical protein